MKLTTLENWDIQLEEVYNGLHLKTRDGEKMIITMRDSGFEFQYQGQMYFAKEGVLEKRCTGNCEMNYCDENGCQENKFSIRDEDISVKQSSK